MSELRKAAQQALEALEADPDAMVEVTEHHWHYTRDLALDALRAALAQQDRASHRTVTYACPVCAASLERQE